MSETLEEIVARKIEQECPFTDQFLTMEEIREIAKVAVEAMWQEMLK